MKTIPSVRSTPVTPSMPSIGGPQAKAFTELIIEFSQSIASTSLSRTKTQAA